MTTGQLVGSGTGEVCDLGVITMRVLADGTATDGACAVLEFRGTEGAWTVPHVHRAMAESFYVLEGTFDFTCDGEQVVAHAGDFVLVPRGTPHMITARAEGGALLGIVAPAGLEDMFRELSTLAGDSIRDPAARRAISQRYDSVPV